MSMRPFKILTDWFINISIVWKSFFSCLLVLFIPVTASAVFFYNHYIKDLSSQKDNLLMKLVAQYGNDVNSKFTSIEYLAEKIITNVPVKQFFYYTGDDVSRKIEEQNGIFAPYLSFLTSLSKDVYQAKFYCYDPGIPNGAYIDSSGDLLNQKWYTAIKELRGNQGMWEGLHICRSDIAAKGAPVFSFYRNLYSQTYSTLVATLQVDIQRDRLFSGLNNARLEKSGFIFIGSTGGVIFSSRGKADEGFSLETSIMKQAVEGGKLNYRSGDEDFIVRSIPLSKLGLILAAAVPIREYNGNIGVQRVLFLGIVAAALVILTLLSYLLTYINSKKLRKVLSGIRKISSGNLQTRIHVKGRDELGEIAEDLNLMTGKLDDMVNIVYKSSIAEKEAMLMALQAQINPHFLYNTLESIKMMAEIKSEYQISDALVTLGKFMRYNISHSREAVFLKDELDNVKNYVQIQKLRFKDLISFSDLVPEELYGSRVLRMTLQPVVENAIIYGSGGRDRAVEIEIRANKQEGLMTLLVRNTGEQIPEERLVLIQSYIGGKHGGAGMETSGNGVGLKNINERIRLVYGENYGVRLYNFNSDGRRGVEVAIHLPS